MQRRRAANGTAQVLEGSPDEHPKSSDPGTPNVPISHIAPALVDLYTVALPMVFGGCCSNVLAYERLLLMNPQIGSALTFSQMLFITVQSLPSFLVFHKSSILPTLKSREVPLEQWVLQVLVLTTGSLLNNWAFAYNVPLTILIVFRSAGLPISMLFGFLFLKRRYKLAQISSIAIVTIGVILATFSRTNTASNENTESQSAEDLTKYFIGISMMVLSLLCTGLLGILQERTYRKYGPCWKEGVFYTHFLALPAFLFLKNDIVKGYSGLTNTSSSSSSTLPLLVLAANLSTQLICVSGVNRLSSQVSSVSTNIALTARKALSLCFSVWWFGNEWNAQLGLGAFMVFFGSLLYSLNGEKTNKKD